MRRAGALVAVVLLLVAPAAGAEPPPSEHDPEVVRQLADDILAREEFQPPEPTLIERILDWIADHLVPGDSEGGGGSEIPLGAAGTGGSSILTTILFVLAVVAIGWIVWRLLGQPRRRRKPSEEDPSTEIEVHRTADEWADLAVRAEAEGRWKDGIRCRFRALVERLVDQGVVPEFAGRTSGELRADLAAVVPAVAGDFARAADLFDRAWYGDLPTGPDEAAAFVAAAANVLTAAAAVGAVAPEPEEVGV